MKVSFGPHPLMRLLRFPPAFVPLVALLCACAGAPQTGGSPADVAPFRAPPARIAPTLPPEGIGTVERYAWQCVEQLGEDFSSGNADGFLGRVSRGFYRGYPALEASLRALIADSDARSAVVAVREVTADGDRVSVRAQWSRTVTRRGVPDERRGETVFLFLKSDTSLRLLDYRGDAPFAIEGI